MRFATFEKVDFCPVFAKIFPKIWGVGSVIAE